ncbi:hypothetical protein J1N35_037694 [Gossypium stocksii]|uniref:Uncharacterized protein n=1 Tax=Gossypium stocksii TaxID=47602 RepID=A0A9D3ZM60_9ROSI|nr:hypothetical protein J1N35_037694 [Gossypium stocksii]
MMPMPCPRHGLIRDLSLRCPSYSQTWSYRGSMSHLGADAMPQTWSYTGPHMDTNAMSRHGLTWDLCSVSMPCPRHGLTRDLQCS